MGGHHQTMQNDDQHLIGSSAQFDFVGHCDPVTLSTEFKKYGWDITGRPKSSRAVGGQLMKSFLWQALMRAEEDLEWNKN